MGAQQPGLPGSQFPSEDALIRRIQDLERAMRELAAANPFAPMGMTPVAGGVNITGNLGVTGTANFTGNTTIGGTATVAGDITKSNSWGTASLGPVAFSAGSPGLSFTKSGTPYGTPVGVGLYDFDASRTSLAVFGPGATNTGAFLCLYSDTTFNLGSNQTIGPQVYSSAGANGSLYIRGGQTNGSVNLTPTGTGNCQVNGNFTVTGTKAFIMDHPVDPDMMTLMHAATESDRNGVEYWGTVTLDTTGEAAVALPSYFEALTKATGRNIQLTPIGRTSVQVSADRIADGAFTIYGAPGQEVDWLVKAERQRIIDGHDELAFPAEQDKLIIGPQLPGSGSR